MIVLGYEWREACSERGQDGVALSDITHMPSCARQKTQAVSQTKLSKESDKEVAVSC